MRTIDDVFKNTPNKPLELSYTDLIAVGIKEQIKRDFPLDMEVGMIKWDLHPTEGYYLSSKKTMVVKYKNKNYKITIEEDDNR